MSNKTHWLQNPNKNYLGHWDLPNSEDVVLTIKSAKWEEVKNPVARTSEAKRVIRFVEDYKWIKPFICNEVNAQAILKSTKEKFMEDCAGKRIKLICGKTKVAGEEVDCIRVKAQPQSELVDERITTDQIEQLYKLIKNSSKTIDDVCAAYKIGGLDELQKSKYATLVKKLKEYEVK